MERSAAGEHRGDAWRRWSDGRRGGAALPLWRGRRGRGVVAAVEEDGADERLDRARDAPAPRDNAKNRLQDVAQKARKPRPTYELLRKDGPDEDPTFTVRVTYDGRAAVAAATGKAPKKRAEILAAHSLLAALGDDAEPAPD